MNPNAENQVGTVQPLLRMEGIEKQFPGVKALDQVNLTVKAGTVHALMGENGAGKSTLMKCLFGVYSKDAGHIFLNGEEVNFRNSKEALEHGVAMVHQELNQALKRNVMDNMWLGRFPTVARGVPFTSEKKMYQATKEVFDRLEVHVDPKAIMSTLPVSQRQMVEIAKAVSYNAKIIVFDEPTSSLTEEEVEHLFKIIHMLRDQGCGIIYISHKMAEILRISDEVTVMRDGKWIATRDAKSLTTDEIIKLMVGRELTNIYPPKTNKIGDELLRVEHLTAEYAKEYDVSFTARKGEIIGVAGLDGSGRSSLLQNIFGSITRRSGTLTLNGKPIRNRNPARIDQERVCAADRRAPRNRNLRDPEHPRKRDDFQSGQMQVGAVPARQQAESEHRLVHSVDARQNADAGNKNPLAVRRQPAESDPRPLAAHGADGAAAGRTDPRHRRGREI